MGYDTQSPNIPNGLFKSKLVLILMISCDKAAEICDKSQYEEAGFWDILKLKIHVFYCKHCKAHSKKNTQLTALCNKANLHTMSASDKEELKKSLQKEL